MARTLRAAWLLGQHGVHVHVMLACGLLTSFSAVTLVYLGLHLTFERNVRIRLRRLKFFSDADIRGRRAASGPEREHRLRPTAYGLRPAACRPSTVRSQAPGARPCRVNQGRHTSASFS